MKAQIILFGLFLTGNCLAEDRMITRTEYVDSWKAVAVSQMIEHGIPASITLAQGILESGSGNSELARKGNNHFGIKCHGWEGKTIYIDDDKANECFRAYKTADESYQDHSAFLKKYDRYAFLFTYDTDDYKSWAEGLKKAGYATNPEYPAQLIKIIEELELSQYDKPSTIQNQSPLIAQDIVSTKEAASNTHRVLKHENNVKYVVASKGDTYFKIAQEYGLNLRQLYRYNSFEKTKDCLETGDIVYIQPKRRRNLFKKQEVVIDINMTTEELSQKYAINQKSLERLNDLDPEQEVAKGAKVTLR